jgi:hypothetical protein
VRKFTIGMSVSISRMIVAWALVVIVPVSLLGQTPSATSSAILHTQGGVWVNNNEANDSAAIFSGDTVETKTGFSANLILEGSAAMMQPESVGTLKDNLLELDHGGVAVETSKIFKVRTHCITVVPVSDDFTQYEVTNVNGSVHVAARKKDVNVEIDGRHKSPVDNAANVGSQNGGSVHEGEEKSYDQSQLCAVPEKLPEARGIQPKWYAIGGGGAAAILVCVLLPCWGGKGNNNNSISPTNP